MPKFIFSKTIFASLILVLLISSCASKEDIIPVGIIEPAKMTKILVDMQIVESTLMHIQQNGMNADKYKKTLYNLVFKKYKISKKTFEKSFTYYSLNNLKLLDKIYANVITSLSQKQSLIKSQ